MTCAPTPGSLCVLRHIKTNEPCLMYRTEDGWKYPNLGGTLESLSGYYVTNWRYAGPAPELPRVPQTPQEIAREALDRVDLEAPRADAGAWAIILSLRDDLLRIAEMEP